MATPLRVPLTVLADPAARTSSLLLKDPQPRPSHNLHSIPSAQAAYDISAHSVQFVAIPNQTRKLQSALPATIREALSLAPAFAGCMVMVSDQEARLVTVVTLWSGKERIRHCNENAEQVKKLLAPYVDHWLRSETNVAHFSMLSPQERKFQECCISTDSVTTLNPR